MHSSELNGHVAQAPTHGTDGMCLLSDALPPLRNGLKGLALCASLGADGCGSAAQDPEPVPWVRVVRDANHTVAIDSGRVSRHWDRSWQVWYRTDHAVPRLHKGKNSIAKSCKAA